MREKYLCYLQEHYSNKYSHNYKTYMLNHVHSRLQYWQPNYKTDLVYGINIPKGQAIEELFGVASSDEHVVEECGLQFRRNTTDCKSNKLICHGLLEQAYLLS